MSDEYKLIILPEAQKDIRDIIIYIAKELIKTVDEQPWKDAGIRKTRVKNYYIYFLVDDDEMSVKVNAVIYVGRDQTKQMTERKMDEL